MKALIKKRPGAGNVEVGEVKSPAPPSGDWALIRVKACGVCGTDVHVWQDLFPSWPPVVLGHEFSGVVEAVGPKCTRVAVGDAVVAEPGIEACGKCEFCRTGRMHLCYSKLTLGWRVDGAMTDYVLMPERLLHAVPPGVDFELAALCEPLAVAVYNVAEAGVRPGAYAVVQGSGPIGALSAYILKRLGARRVLLTGVDASENVRFPICLACGADAVVNVVKQSLREIVMDETGGLGADYVVETSGAPSAIGGSVELLKKNGVLIGTGIPADDRTPFAWRDAVMKAISVRFCMSTSYTAWDSALALMAQDGDILRRLITWTGKIDDWEKVFTELTEEKQMKAVFRF